MTLQIWFWLGMAIWLLFGIYSDYVPGQPYPFRAGARSFLLFALLAILGWAQFGSPVK